MPISVKNSNHINEKYYLSEQRASHITSKATQLPCSLQSLHDRTALPWSCPAPLGSPPPSGMGWQQWQGGCSCWSHGSASPRMSPDDTSHLLNPKRCKVNNDDCYLVKCHLTPLDDTTQDNYRVNSYMYYLPC